MHRSCLTVLLAGLLAVGCADIGADPRETLLVDVLTRADMVLLRTRPALMEGKFGRMARLKYDFYRGTYPLWLRDAEDGRTRVAQSRFAVGVPVVGGIGDAHPENFGALRGADGVIALEPNDFDAADPLPYLWELRRLATGMVVGARDSNRSAPAAQATASAASRDIARETVVGYRDAVLACSGGDPRPRVTDGGGNPILTDVFSRSVRDLAARAELPLLTVVDGGTRRFKRGVPDPEDLENVLQDLPEEVVRTLETQTLPRYRRTLLAPPDAAYFTVLDAVRELGSGVASWPRIRVLVLVRGPSDDVADDVILEVKELLDSGARGWTPPGVYADAVGPRVVAAARNTWAVPDAAPLWGHSEWIGMAVQVRQELEGQKTIRVSRWEGARGTPAAIAGAGARLGALLGAMHCRSTARDAFAPLIARDPEGFADEQADAAVAQADVVDADFVRFRHALTVRGMRLGAVSEPSDLPSPSLRAILGVPPTPAPFQ